MSEINELPPKKMPRGRPANSGDYKECFAIANKHNIDVFAELILIAKDEKHPKRLDAILGACKYLYTQRRAVEVTGDLDVNINQQQLVDLKAKALALRSIK